MDSIQVLIQSTKMHSFEKWTITFDAPFCALTHISQVFFSYTRHILASTRFQKQACELCHLHEWMMSCARLINKFTLCGPLFESCGISNAGHLPTVKLKSSGSIFKLNNINLVAVSLLCGFFCVKSIKIVVLYMREASALVLVLIFVHLKFMYLIN